MVQSLDATLHAVWEYSAFSPTEGWETVLTKHEFSMFKLLELHECKVEVLEERSKKV